MFKYLISLISVPPTTLHALEFEPCDELMREVNRQW
jgi:hypothetical protein